jgi:peptidoglycan/LPS O-acetylase OafA/YrhL
VQFAGVSAFAFPLNVPAWSLFFEAVANVLHVLLLRCRSIMFLALTTAFGGVVFFTFAVRAGGMDLGSHRTELVPGVARVVMSYVGGCLLFRLWKRQSIRFAAPPWLVAVLLLAMLVGPPVGRRGGFLYDAVVTLACFPVLLLASANAQPPVRYARMFQWLGVSSYAVYILHVPLAAAYFAVCARLVRGPGFATHALTETIIFLLLLVVTAMLVDRWYDTPVRGWLRLRLQTARGGAERSADFTARGA